MHSNRHTTIKRSMPYDNLQKLMQNAGMRKGDLAAMLKRDNAVVTNLFKGGRPLYPEEAKMLAAHFGVSTDIILDNAEYDAIEGMEAPKATAWKSREAVMGSKPTRQTAMIPVVSFVGAGAEVYPIDDYDKGDGMDMVEAPRTKNLDPARAIALEVRGDSMEPFIHEGFLLFYDMRIYGVPNEWLSKICVVKVEDGPTYVKRIKKGDGLGLFHLCSLNPSEPDRINVSVEWCALVKVMVQR